jgi:hypothetical protein
MNAQEIALQLVGTRPLIMRSGRLADPLDPVSVDLARITGKRPKTVSDHEEIGRLEWHGGLWLDGARPCLPAEAIEACFLAAARTRRRGKAAAAGFLVENAAILQFEGPDTIEELWLDARFRLRHAVRVGDARTMRTRPRFPNWRAQVRATFLPSVLNEAEIRDLFAVAGFSVGLGDWRPRFGRFEIL